MTKPVPLNLPTARALEGEARARLAPTVEVPDIFTPEECRRIVALHDTLGHDEATFPARDQPDAGTRRLHEVDYSRRYSHRTHILAEPRHAWIYDRVAAATDRANQFAWQFKVSFLEPLQLLLYPVGGTIDWHSDLGDRGLTSYRKISATILLSAPEEYEGGRLEVMSGGRILQPGCAQGLGVFFPSFQNHRVTAVTAGQRAVLIVWTLGRRPLA